MDLNLNGKVAVVTGSAQGIGKAVAQIFAAEGAQVIVADLDEEGAKKVSEGIESSGGRAAAVKVDVSREEDTVNMAKTALARFGRIDILVNNAGMWVLKPFKNLTPADWQKEVNVNYFGALNCTKAVLDNMLEQRSGSIINMVSAAARVGEPAHPTYCGAKGAVMSFTKALAKDIGPKGIRVNAVAPGWTETEGSVKVDDETRKKMLKSYPLRKAGQPQDVANMVVFLASERAGQITGQTIGVDGGYCMI